VAPVASGGVTSDTRQRRGVWQHQAGNKRTSCSGRRYGGGAWQMRMRARFRAYGNPAMFRNCNRRWARFSSIKHRAGDEGWATTCAFLALCLSSLGVCLFVPVLLGTLLPQALLLSCFFLFSFCTVTFLLLIPSFLLFRRLFLFFHFGIFGLLCHRFTVTAHLPGACRSLHALPLSGDSRARWYASNRTFSAIHC